MIEFLVCPVEIIVREPLIPLEAGSQKTGPFSDLSQQGLDLIFERVLSGGEVFRDRNLLRHDYMPGTLLHREEQIRLLVSVFAPAITNEEVSNLFAYGKTGTVKT